MLFRSLQNIIIMPLIVTATDFSEIAENAVVYACQLAESRKSKVVVLHAYMLPVMFSDVPMPSSIVKDEEKDAREMMDQLLSRLRSRFPGVDVEGKVLYGDTIDILEDLKAGDAGPWMVVVGNNSQYAHTSWVESVLLTAFKSLTYPVLAVPPGAVFRSIRRLCFAMDNKPGGYEDALEQIVNITSGFRAELHVLTILPANPQHEQEETATQHHELLSTINPVYHLVKDAADVDEAILAFTEKNDFDWLVLMPRKHSFFDALMHKSHTRALAHHSRIPILALHEHKD